MSPLKTCLSTAHVFLMVWNKHCCGERGDRELEGGRMERFA